MLNPRTLQSFHRGTLRATHRLVRPDCRGSSRFYTRIVTQSQTVSIPSLLVNFRIPEVAPEAPVSLPICASASVSAPESRLSSNLAVVRRWAGLVKRMLRILARAGYLAAVSTPLLLAYPIAGLSDSFHKQWMRSCVFGVEMCGAAVIKLFQWASSRPDIFGQYFCDTFSRLQDKTTPHKFRDTERMMAEAFGEDWRDKIKFESTTVIGSGCIGQVYKAELTDGTPVAVKILHPNVDSGIEADLDVLRLAARLLAWCNPKFYWMNPTGMVEEFAGLLSEQLDLRVEGRNLKKFNKNFSDDENIRFPRVLSQFQPTEKVLVEEFIEGLTLEELLLKHRENVPLRNELCDKGIEVICRMIFEHNFVHGDIHPGNILFSDDATPKMVLLDAGIAKRFTKYDHGILVGVLTSFIGRDGTKAANLLIEDSMKKINYAPENVGGFRKVVEDMVQKAVDDHSFFDQIGNYVTTLVDASSKHSVLMNKGFVSIALSVRIMEGIALALNKDADIVSVAQPIILKEKAKQFLNRRDSRFDEDKDVQ